MKFYESFSIITMSFFMVHWLVCNICLGYLFYYMLMYGNCIKLLCQFDYNLPKLITFKITHYCDDYICYRSFNLNNQLQNSVFIDYI